MVKVFAAFWIVFGAIVVGQKYWQSWVTLRAADLPQQTDYLSQPTSIVPTIDPGQMSRSLNSPGVVSATRRP